MYIEIEDFIASAFIERMKQGGANRRVSLRTLAAYGEMAVKALNASGQHAISLLSKARTDWFVRENADWFTLGTVDDVAYIELKDGVSVMELRQRFQRNLTVELAKALLDEESLRVLLN